jgi:hypothetical protein
VQGQPTRYPAARALLFAGLGGLALAAVSASISLSFPAAWVATGALALSGLIAVGMGLIPGVEIGDTHLVQRRTRISWTDIYQVRRLAATPLILRLTLASREETLVIYCGPRSARESLLHDIRLMSRSAVIDGVSYREFWGLGADEPGKSKPRRYPLLLADDEAEVERMFQQLKSVGHLEPNNAPPDRGPERH